MKKFLIFLCLNLFISCQIVQKEAKGCIIDKIYKKPYTTTQFIMVGKNTIPRYIHHPEQYVLKIYNKEIDKTLFRTVSKDQYNFFSIGDTITYCYKTTEF